MMLPQVGVSEDLAHLRGHVRLREVKRREALRRLVTITRASVHALVDRRIDGTDDPEQDERECDEIERTLAIIAGVGL